MSWLRPRPWLESKLKLPDGTTVEVPGISQAQENFDELEKKFAPKWRYAEVLTEETTTSTSATDLATPGPSLSVDVPPNAMVMIYIEVELKTSSGTVAISLYEATDMPGSNPA